MVNEYKLSIIIPVYNVEKYLEKCLNSILCQISNDVEIICIEDCSTDKSYNILLEFAKNDSRIHIIKNKINRGVSYCRNQGIYNSHGKFIIFVDSDDYVADDILMKMYNYSESEKLEMLFCDVELVDEDVERYSGKQIRTRKNVYKDSTGIELFEKLIENNEMFGAVWGAMYKTALIKENKILFREGVLHEDIAFVFRALTLCKKAGCMNQIGYYYVQRQGSIMNADNMEKRMVGMAIACFDLLTIWNQIEGKTENLNLSVSKFINIYYKVLQGMYEKMQSENLEYKNPMVLYLRDMGWFSQRRNQIHISSLDIQLIRESKYVIIYGGKKTALDILSYLNERNIHVAAFTVSDLENNEREIRQIPVIAFDELNYPSNETTILIGVSAKYRNEIKQKLLENGYWKIVDEIV